MSARRNDGRSSRAPTTAPEATSSRPSTTNHSMAPASTQAADDTPYTPPSFPLDQESLHRLTQLVQQTQQGPSRANTSLLAKLKDHQKNAVGLLADVGGDANERVKMYEEKVKKKDERRRRKLERMNRGGTTGEGEGDGSQPAGGEAVLDEDEDPKARLEKETLEELRTKVDRLTKQLDEGVQKMIDSQAILGFAEKQLAESRTKAVANAREWARAERDREDASTQAREARREERARRALERGTLDGRDEGEGDLMDVDSSGATANDTQPTIPGMTPNNMAPEAISVAQFFKDCLGAEEADYQRLSRHARFASHNDYVNFRRVIWDSQHHIGPDGEMAAMPPRSTWFRDRGSPAPGVTGSQQDGAEGHDEDDDMDIEVARERISTKCPLTLQELVDPVTSRKCPHTFERSAIMNMINSSGMRAGGSHARGARDGERVVQCPVPGCSKMLLKSDLFADPLLQRRIRRIQEARRQSDEFEDEDEDDMKDDDSDTAANAAMVTSSQASLPESQIKAERRSQHSPPQRRQQVLQSSQADGVDLGGEDTEDE